MRAAKEEGCEDARLGELGAKLNPLSTESGGGSGESTRRRRDCRSMEDGEERKSLRSQSGVCARDCMRAPMGPRDDIAGSGVG